MGVRIDWVAAARSRRAPWSRGALRLTDAAARACLAGGGHEASDVDLLVNVGLYKEKNLAEPALASIIQEDIGANPGHPPVAGHHGTFSFDVANGGCGVLTAAHLVDGFARSGAMRLALVVAADADPSPAFRFGGVGAAMLLETTDGDEGFDAFELRTFPEHARLFEASLVWEPRRGRHAIVVREDPAFAARAVECAATVVHALLDRSRVSPSEIDLVIASQQPASFPDAIARALGVDAARVPAGAGHTAGPLVALEAAMRSGRFAASRRVLFVTVGAGLAVVAALYRR